MKMCKNCTMIERSMNTGEASDKCNRKGERIKVSHYGCCPFFELYSTGEQKKEKPSGYISPSENIIQYMLDGGPLLIAIFAIVTAIIISMWKI